MGSSQTLSRRNNDFCDTYKSKHGLKSNYSNTLRVLTLLNRPLEEQLTSFGGAVRNSRCLTSFLSILVAAVAGAVLPLCLQYAGTAIGSLGGLAILCLFHSPKISQSCFRVS